MEAPFCLFYLMLHWICGKDPWHRLGTSDLKNIKGGNESVQLPQLIVSHLLPLDLELLIPSVQRL